MNDRSVWSAEEIIRVTGGRWHIEPSLGSVYTRVTFPVRYVQERAVLLHVVGRGWPTKSIDGSGQHRSNIDELILRFGSVPGLLIVTSEVPTTKTDLPVLVVESTYESLFAMAEHRRASFSGRIVAITGTAGKSSTKDFLGALLDIKGPTYASVGNWNTVEGIAFNLANLSSEDEFAVIEVSGGAILGMRGRSAVEMVRHHDAIITSIGVNLTSRTPTAESVAAVKSKLFSALPDDGRAYRPFEIQCHEILDAAADGRQLTIIGQPNAGAIAINLLRSGVASSLISISCGSKSDEADVSVVGSGQLSNLSLAAQCASDFGLPFSDLVEGISHLKMARRKMESHTTTIEQMRVSFLDDSHNATLVSFRSALDHVQMNKHCVSRIVIIVGKIVHIDGMENTVYDTLAEEIWRLSPFSVVLFDNGLERLADALRCYGLNAVESSDPVHVVSLVRSSLVDNTLIFLKGSHRGTRIRELSQVIRDRLWPLQ
ncbi:Mur ligase family protein [Mesorhizobium sp. M0833]|uniref:Mur ligase family protein n=1 Tax=Mesorhizobium sp. M0833 TaxID=2957009 RepID=UPI00333D95BE